MNITDNKSMNIKHNGYSVETFIVILTRKIDEIYNSLITDSINLDEFIMMDCLFRS